MEELFADNTFENKVSNTIKNRQETKTHLFNDVLLNLIEPSEEFKKANSVKILNNFNFGSSFLVHKGYYDSKRNSTLYVKTKCGDIVRKDTTYLTVEGEFLKGSSELIIDITYDDIQRKIYKAKYLKDTEALNFLKDKYYFYKDNYLVPFKLKHFKMLATSPSILGSVHIDFSNFNESFLIPIERINNSFCTFTPILTEKHLEGYLELVNDIYLKLPINSVSDSIKTLQGRLKKDNLKLAISVYPKHDNSINFCLIKQDLNKKCLEYSFYPIIKEYEIINENTLLPIVKNLKGIKKTNRRLTRNNEGCLMNYTSRVPDYKDSFKMTNSEQHYYNSLKIKYKNIRKRYLDKIDKLESKSVLSTTELDLLNSLKNKVINKSFGVIVTEPIFLGLELEVKPKGSSSSIIKKISDSDFGEHCLIKSDISINNGFEIVTIPATLKYHKEVFNQSFFKNDKNNLASMLSVDNSCGLHVHINRKCFTHYTLGKLITFINKPDNSDFIHKFAGREPNTYCKKIELIGKNKKGVDLSPKITSPKNINLYRENSFYDRRTTVNLSTSNTVELRLFKASTNKNNILRKLEFCEALTKFVRTYPTRHMDVYHFIEFINKETNRKDYQYLLRWLAHYKYIEYSLVRIPNTNKVRKSFGKILIPATQST